MLSDFETYGQTWQPPLVTILAIEGGTLPIVKAAFGHRHRRLSEPITRTGVIAGDPALAASAALNLPGKGIYALGLAKVSPEGATTATIGTSLESTFEIGSITKGITGMLFADAVARGEVRPGTTLGELLDLGGRDCAGLTLEQLSQHRSGLPSHATGFVDVARIAFKTAQAKNPFEGATREDLVQDLRRVAIGPKVPSYSNLGFAALGHALASAAGTDYPALIRDRVAQPLGLEAFYVPTSAETSPDDRGLSGRDEHGRAQQAWTDQQYAPAGGVRSDVASMATLAQALLTGSAPGAESLDPVADFSFNGEDRIGAGWMTSQIGGRTITWHNGGTGGFSSWIGLDRAHNRAVIILGATSLSLDDIGETLLLTH